MILVASMIDRFVFRSEWVVEKAEMRRESKRVYYSINECIQEKSKRRNRFTEPSLTMVEIVAEGSKRKKSSSYTRNDFPLVALKQLLIVEYFPTERSKPINRPWFVRGRPNSWHIHLPNDIWLKLFWISDRYEIRGCSVASGNIGMIQREPEAWDVEGVAIPIFRIIRAVRNLLGTPLSADIDGEYFQIHPTANQRGHLGMTSSVSIWRSELLPPQIVRLNNIIAATQFPLAMREATLSQLRPASSCLWVSRASMRNLLTILIIS